MTDQLTIRPFQDSDLPELQRIRQAAFRPVFQSFRDIVGEKIGSVAFARADAEQAEYLETLVQPDSGHEMYVVLAPDEIAGFCSISYNVKQGTGEIGLNAVRPDRAGAGIGTFMYEYVLKRMQERGIVVVEVSTGGDPAHAPARRAYEKAGFGLTIPAVTFYKLL